MEIVNTFLIVPFLVGPIFILAGLVMLAFPPRKINGLYGYRTPSSMKSQERWDFAQKYSANELIKSGGILMLASTIGFVIELTDTSATIIGLGFMVAAVIVLFLRVEKAIKKRFSE